MAQLSCNHHPVPSWPDFQTAKAEGGWCPQHEDNCQGPHQVTSNCEWVFLMNEWNHWAVWPTLKQSIASGVLNIHRKGLNQRKLTSNMGPLLPGKLPFHPSHPFPNSPLTLEKDPRRCPTHPAHFPFIHSLIQQILTVCLSVPGSVGGAEDIAGAKQTSSFPNWFCIWNEDTHTRSKWRHKPKIVIIMQKMK